MSDSDVARWQPSATLEISRLRAAMLRNARQFFDEHDILEVTTPTLSVAAVSDVHIESIEVRLAVRAANPYYLHTSPEFAMKRLLCAGWPDIYQICSVYRDGEVGERHQPEFTMIEWYRLGSDFRAMMEHTVEFLTVLVQRLPVKKAPVFIEYASAFKDALNIDVGSATVEELASACDADATLRATLGDRRDDWLDYLLCTRVTPTFAKDRFTVLYHYPATQAALAQLCPADPQVADRFEVFFGESELANGYAELQDAAEQRERMRQDQDLRRSMGRAERPLDTTFLAALEAGLPACCGVAVGFDRLVMLNSGTRTINDVQLFTAVADTDSGNRDG